MQNRDIGQSRARGLARGQIIKQLRIQEKVTAADLAERLGATKALIAGWESGQIPAGDKVMQRVHEALNLKTYRTPPENDQARAKTDEEIMEALAGALAQITIMKAMGKAWKTRP